MISIGLRNLKQAPFRFLIAAGSVTFAVVLITCEIGMMMGMTRNASILVDRSHADLLVSAPCNKTFNFAGPIARRKLYQVASIPGVTHVEEFNNPISQWRASDGNAAPIQIVAFDLNGKLAPRPEMLSGQLADLHNRDAVVIDESATAMLGHPEIGEVVEVIGQRARVVGICKNMVSFSTIPMVFTSLNRGDKYGWMDGNGVDSNGGQSFYFLVSVDPKADLDQVMGAISARVKGVEVHTRSGISWRTRGFWLIETGMGMAFLFVGFLGLLVGGVILSQTLFALTIDRLPEFGLLKALGAGMAELSRVVLEQGLICGVGGLIMGFIVSFGVQALARSTGTEVEISLFLICIVSVLALALSGAASLLSIIRLRNLEPASVFRT